MRAGRTISTRLSIPSTYYAVRLLAQAGQGVFVAGLLLFAGQGSDSALGLSSVLVGMMLGAVLFGLPAGAFADRLGAARALALGAFGRMAVMAGTLLLLGEPALAAAVGFTYSAASQLYSPSELALVPSIAPNRPARSHAILVALQYVGQGAGIVVLAPAAYFIGGAAAMIACGVAVYSVVTLLAFSLSLRLTLPAAAIRTRESLGFGEAARYFRHDRRALHGGVLLAFAELATKVTFIAAPVYMSELRLESLEPAAIAVPAVLGALAGLVWGGRVCRAHLAPRAMRVGVVATVLSMACLAGVGEFIARMAAASGVAPLAFLRDPVDLNVTIAIPAAFFLGACFAIAPIAGRTIFTSTAPPRHHSRIFAMQATATDLLVAVPLLLAGVAADVVGAQAAFFAVAAVGAIILFVIDLFPAVHREPHPVPA